MNPRALLGVGPFAGPEEIRAAYRKHAARLHPDRNPDPMAAEQFKDITKAYESLLAGEEVIAAASPSWARPGEVKNAFDAVTSIVDSFLSGILGAAPPGRAQILADIRVDLRVTRKQAMLGDTVSIEVASRETCPQCAGLGRHHSTPCGPCSGHGSVSSTILGLVSISVTCSSCSGCGLGPCVRCLGTAWVPVVRKVSLRVPAGLTEGLRLRFSGQGDADPSTGLRGDLLCDVRIVG